MRSATSRLLWVIVVWVIVGCLLAVTACSAPPPPARALTERVPVAQGELAGRLDAGVFRYQGIPFAAPPVGELRWQPPQAPQPWTGIRDATTPGARCAQLAPPPGTPHATAASTAEDCLFLDVTVPAGTATDTALPVLVWIHGGGFAAGAGSDVDPRRLAAAGPMVVVTPNYRLGAFGFFGLPDMPGSGAFGLMDQQAALDWVQRNIAAFGGDPTAVTLGGTSAGADSVCSQLAAPRSAGMFARAILQSGGCGTANLVDVIRPGAGPGGDTWKPLPLVEAAGASAAAALGCPDPATAAACMRAVPAEQLVGGDTYWSPAFGTPTLPRRPSDLVAADDLRPLPVLAGTVRNEGTLFTNAYFDRAGAPLTDNRFRTMLAQSTSADAATAGGIYRVVERSPGRAWSDVITDRAYACSGLVTYREVAEEAPLWAYEFADPSAPSPFAALPPDLADGPAHGAELPYLFDLVPGQPRLTPDQQALSARMIAAWARFVTSGNPNGPGAPEWPQWAGTGEILTLAGAEPAAVPAADFAAAHHCAFWGL